MAAYVTQQERSNNKCYILAFRYTYKYKKDCIKTRWLYINTFFYHKIYIINQIIRKNISN